MRRAEQLALIITFLGFSWLAMQAVHEFGHALAAWVTGADVTKVALHPFTLSRTDLGHNPHPSLVVWAGPVVGSVLPLTVFLIAKVLRSPGLYLFRFFAGFCLVANGVYIGAGPSEGGADTAVMMLHGSPRWLLMLFGLFTAGLGLYLWHRQGRYFGLGVAKGRVDRKAAIVSALLFLSIVGIELVINSR